MNTRALVGMMLVGALFASNAAAEPLVTVDAGTLLGAAPEFTGLSGTPELVLDALVEELPTAPVEQLLECTLAVELPVTWWGGNAVASETHGLDVVVAVETALEHVTQLVPVMGTVQETVWQPSGLLGGLPAITRDVTGVVGYEEVVVETESEILDYNVVIEWKETQIAWTAFDETLLLALPIGLPFADDGRGSLVTACEGQSVLTALPAFRNTDDFDYVKIAWGGSDRGDHTGWYMHVLDVDVSLADADDAGKERFERTGHLLCPTDLIRNADAKLADLQTAILRGDVPVPESAITGSDAPPADAETQSVQGAAVGVNLLGIALAALVAAIGALAALRRFKS